MPLDRNESLYVAVGGKGEDGKPCETTSAADFTYPQGGWNGGGNGGAPSFSEYYGALHDGSAGGGATSIQSSLIGYGQLKNYANNSDYVAIVAGGSGYLKSTLFDISWSEKKHMAGYNVRTSDEANTRTVSVTCAKEKPTANCAKFGNGYVRITYLGAERIN